MNTGQAAGVGVLTLVILLSLFGAYLYLLYRMATSGNLYLQIAAAAAIGLPILFGVIRSSIEFKRALDHPGNGLSPDQQAIVDNLPIGQREKFYTSLEQQRMVTK
jgi:hypothetical protein